MLNRHSILREPKPGFVCTHQLAYRSLFANTVYRRKRQSRRQNTPWTEIKLVLQTSWRRPTLHARSSSDAKSNPINKSRNWRLVWPRPSALKPTSATKLANFRYISSCTYGIYLLFISCFYCMIDCNWVHCECEFCNVLTAVLFLLPLEYQIGHHWLIVEYRWIWYSTRD